MLSSGNELSTQMILVVSVGLMAMSGVVLYIIYLYFSKDKSSPSVPSGQTPIVDASLKTSILDQVKTKDRILLQSRVANARSADDLFSVFDEFEFLHKLKLPMSMVSADHIDMKDQIFRDLVREKINVNDLPVKFDDDVYSHPKEFQKLFIEKIENEIAHHVPSKKSRQILAMHICCHLSRTRAGGDSLFAVKDIFDTPQLIITASHTDTHPPTDLHITDDGWASITTTSNFDVYLYDDLHPDEDAEEDCCPTPMVTFSARLEEAIAVKENMKVTETKRPFSPSTGNAPTQPERTPSGSLLDVITSSLSMEGRPSLPHPLYRRMSIVCFDPYNPDKYSGGVDSSAIDPHASLYDMGHHDESGLHQSYRPDSSQSFVAGISRDEAEGYVYLHNRSDSNVSPYSGGDSRGEDFAPVSLSRARSAPGAMASSETSTLDQGISDVTSTGLRKRGTFATSAKVYGDSMDISTGCDGVYGVGGHEEGFRGGPSPSSGTSPSMDDPHSYQSHPQSYHGHFINTE